MQDVLPLQIHSKVCCGILPHCRSKLWQTSGCRRWQLALVIRKGRSLSPAPHLISCRGPLLWWVLCSACWWITGCTEMTIITHNAPREGGALRHNISHKYAERLKSSLRAISRICFFSVQGCSNCMLTFYVESFSFYNFCVPVNPRILHKDALTRAQAEWEYGWVV